ncbi:hypothetical protein GUITHDRAFT_143780 [Guillardia theta CCMP2712]|uniref:Uncharacterized protein n=1 Tax=Guillardia theta (strain CCMP2712) TaxID=905079 RepID=L1IT00_GUITC|nr:hypothetical protein GUITHDRAFT_143780 [Guillardia theta CCMP2712]EKX38965.1 hypothetical protein GUITHDRAFT_143780 [Guillardia theta CCMP2712]|eukprot:XP_005825945.1 hypothetical protein GUITHDRAFT_143780 [Guillardia theta CCMP2712]
MLMFTTTVSHALPDMVKPARIASPSSSVVDIAAFFKTAGETDSIVGDALEDLANLSLPDTNDQEQGIFELDTSLNKSLAPSRYERVHLESSYEEGGEERYVMRGRWEGVRGKYNRSIAMSAMVYCMM